jgi:hypothetical protein
MHNQHTDLSQTLADQHIAALQDFAGQLTNRPHSPIDRRHPCPCRGSPKL